MNTAEGRTGHVSWFDYQDHGNTEGLMLLHSLGADAHMWSPQLDALREVRRVLVPEMPGHGHSTAKPRDYTLDELGADVLLVADESGLDEFDICGISLGGLIAMWLAINTPHRIRSLIVANTAARIGTPESWAGRIENVRRGGMAGIRDEVLPSLLSAGFPAREPTLFAELERRFDAIDPAGYIGCCGVLRDSDLGSSISTIAHRTLVVGGELDASTPPVETRRIHDQVQDSRIEIIPGAAHLSNLDQPVEFTRVVLESLQASV